MRSILNISLPEAKKKAIQERAKKVGKSVSAYVLYSLELEQSLISEDELLEIVREGEKEHREGKTKKLRSLADLI